MKNPLIFILSLLPFFPANSNAQQTVDHEIEAITVYLNSAEITRSATASIPSGKSDILLSGISNRILGKGMKVSISSDVKVYAISLETNDDFRVSSKDWIALEKEMEVIDAAINHLNTSREILFKEIEFFSSNMKIGGDKGATYSEIDEGAKYFRARMGRLQDSISKVENKLKGLNKSKLEKIKEQNELRIKLDQTNTSVKITVVSNTTATAKINLRYLVSNAVWKPYYSLRAKGDDEPILLEYQAQVYNDTGHDWDNKPITLAIMDPSDDVSKPVLNVWVLDDNRKNNSFKQEGLLNKSKGSLRDIENNGKRQKMDVLQIDDLSTRFEIKDLHLIPSDATPHLIDVTSYTKPADYYTLSIPKVKNGAFLIARIPDWQSLGLLDGPVNLYYDESYQGVSNLETRIVNDTLEISLGKENSFAITRRKLGSMSSEKLIGFNIKETLTYELIVKNSKAEAARIEIRDQLPVATSKDVEVKVIELSGGKRHALSGQLSWDLNLAPNETKRILIKFSVKYPKSKRGILRHNRRILATPRFF